MPLEWTIGYQSICMWANFAPPPLPRILFSTFKKRYFFFVAQPLPPPPLLVAGQLKQNNFLWLLCETTAFGPKTWFRRKIFPCSNQFYCMNQLRISYLFCLEQWVRRHSQQWWTWGSPARTCSSSPPPKSIKVRFPDFYQSLRRFSIHKDIFA